MEINKSPIWDCNFEKTKVDHLMLEGKLSFNLFDEGIRIITDSDPVSIVFDQSRYRSLEVPILLSNTSRLKKIGFRHDKNINYLINEQMQRFNI